ncbi:amylo-alpha-1,6-glucosidase [Hymenobacter terricola]|uniref:amylo-alpha-1,6-glucosidase n=1 Tax=Hymenobacter terricola TaxID=2819236 RepID=UPI001B312B2C|nr:amylo-alpha-1,6-glucosidase [Hymenobacter terricola]
MSPSFDQFRWLDSGATLVPEWLETNGLGGWASATLSGALSRRYHGLLVAATTPPVGRQVLLSKLDETLVLADGPRWELGCNQYPGTVHPTGHRYLKAFFRDLFPVFEYEAGGVGLRKTVAAVHGHNTTLVVYEVLAAPGPFVLELLPLLAGRDYHTLGHHNAAAEPAFQCHADTYHVIPRPHSAALFLTLPGAVYAARPTWYYQLEYAQEQERGQDFREDLFSPGVFQRVLSAGDTFGLVISTEPCGPDSAETLLAQEAHRRTALLAAVAPPDALRRALTLAADQFVVRRAADLNTVIAGYHWFTDWGRDTMISLPGLCLVTGRFAEARRILQAFAAAVSEGLLPNRFPDSGAAPEYNTVDATLWFFVAVQQYQHYSGDADFVQQALLSVLTDILAWHRRGTRYGIRVAENGLLSAGAEGEALTWMDARVGGWAVTPRRGQPVEIQALWYNALYITATLLHQAGRPAEAAELEESANRAAAAFEPAFWNEEQGCLYDCLPPAGPPDAALRPNQLLALSLPYPLLSGARAARLLAAVEQALVTPVGLRSLAPTDPAYCPRYRGGPVQRDGAYHQGTVWSWWLGPYCDALVRVHGPEAGSVRVQAVLDGFAYHLGEAGLGTVSEIFDGEAPHQPRGCIAQAWGVAEILRVACQYPMASS